MTRETALVPSALGPIEIEVVDTLVRSIRFAGERVGEEPAVTGPTAQTVAQQLQAYFAGTLTKFDLKLESRGTPFQRAVWGQMAQIPFGQTVSYKQLAERVGTHSARAIGVACGENPFPIVIPCHRVIASDGTFGGYSGGIARKQWLLRHEAGVSGKQGLLPW